MSRAETRRRRILRDDGTGLVQKTCTNRFWAARAVSYPARAAIPSSIARQPIPPSPGEDCFPESAPGTARGVRDDANTHLDLGRLEGRDGAGEGGGNAGHFCCWFLCCKEGEVCRNGASAPRNARFIGQQLLGRVGEGQLGQSSRGKKSQSAYLLAPWILCRGESKSSPPARMDGQSRKSHPWRSNPNRRPGTIARTTDSGWNAKGKPLRAFIGWSGSIPGRCHRGHFHNRDRISISGASEKEFFVWQPVSEMPRFEWTTWHTNRPPRLMIADEKIFSCTKAEILPRRLHSPAHVL